MYKEIVRRQDRSYQLKEGDFRNVWEVDEEPGEGAGSQLSVKTPFVFPSLKYLPVASNPIFVCLTADI